MLGKLIWKLLWGSAKLVVKFVLVPIVVSAAVGALLTAWAEKVREGTPGSDGRLDPVIRPQR